MKEGFNPDLGLFLPTTDQRLYPNPHVREVLPGTGLRLLEFLGKVLGKAMYEGQQAGLEPSNAFVRAHPARLRTASRATLLLPAHA